MKIIGFIAALLPLSALAQATTAAAPVAAASQNSLMGVLPPLAMMAIVFYVLLIRPQQKRMKEQSAMQSGLKKGDEVITAGGVIGKFVRDLDNGAAIVEIAAGVEVKLVKSTIASAVANKNPATIPANQLKKKAKGDQMVKNDNVVPDKDQVANDN